MLAYKRATRVGELLQQEISKILQEIYSPENGFLTVTGVKLTDDLYDARVFYSLIGSEEQKARSQQILLELIPEIRHRIAQSINMRRTPMIIFSFDETPEKASKIFEILEKIHNEGAAPAKTSKPRAPRKGSSKKK